MNYEIREEDVKVLAEYARIPIAFEVASVFDVEPVNKGLSGFVFAEHKLAKPYVKDYDAVEKCRPTSWSKRWDISKWGVVSAFAEGERVGGCVIAYDTEGVQKLKGEKTIAVLWDIRVLPAFRRKGVGSLLFEAAVVWARERKCLCLNVETQNINVPACRFYAKQNCVLVTVDRMAYPEFPGEVELVWCKEWETVVIRRFEQ